MLSTRLRRTSLAAGAGALAASGAAVAFAAIPSQSGEITACYGKVTGLIRVIDSEAGQKCTNLERPLNWNQQGQPGPVGPAGPSGATHVVARRGTPTTLQPNEGGSSTAKCHSGEVATGGGYDALFLKVEFSGPTPNAAEGETPDGWTVFAGNTLSDRFPGSHTLTAFALCAAAS